MVERDVVGVLCRRRRQLHDGVPLHPCPGREESTAGSRDQRSCVLRGQKKIQTKNPQIEHTRIADQISREKKIPKLGAHYHVRPRTRRRWHRRCSHSPRGRLLLSFGESSTGRWRYLARREYPSRLPRRPARAAAAAAQRGGHATGRPDGPLQAQMGKGLLPASACYLTGERGPRWRIEKARGGISSGQRKKKV